MKKIFSLFACLAVSVVSFGQDKSVSTSDVPPVPSMEETQKWIKREIPLLGSYSKMMGKNDDRTFIITFKYAVENAVLEDCRLSLLWTMDVTYASRQTFTNTVNLRDVDVDKIRTVEEPLAKGFTQSRPSYIVMLDASADRGEPFTSQMKQEGKPAGDTKPTRSVGVRVGDKEGANRAVEVFRRATTLCRVTNNSTGFPANTEASKMTNSDVIEMVKAGLSEQILTTSIRQASAKNFDLSPIGLIALKKGGVSDPVILVMQEVSATGSVSSGGDKMPKANSPSSPSDPNAILKQELLRYLNQANDAQIAGDKVTFDKLLTDDYSFFINGKTYSKESLLKNMKPLKGVSIEIGNTESSSDGNTATLTGTGVTHYPDCSSVSYQFISKFIKRDEQWKQTSSTLSKDYATSTQPEKPKVAPVSQNGCDGIENLGVYKNDLMDSAIGGGVVEWVAKIRNNTGITKIVTYGWRDMYGQQKKAQIQIRGGDIARLRLDMTQARVIPPVTDGRVLSCQ
jgi:Domain of unknown function (DUF4440)